MTSLRTSAWEATHKDAACKTEFFAYVIFGEQSANLQKQLQNDAFRVKTSQSAKN